MAASGGPMTTEPRPSPAAATNPEGATPAVAVSGLSKSYGGIRALIDMDMEVETGTIHAVVGENGAGKSTLMKILAGAVKADQGRIRLDGETVRFAAPPDARRAGIGIVYQELSLFPDRSVLANLFADELPTRLGVVDHGAMLRAARPVLDDIGLDADPDSLVGELDLDARQLVEISRVLIETPRLLILDEPNSALNDRETERLFDVLRALRDKGVTMLYVSHRLEEVFAIADRITVMRNGRLAFTRGRAEVTMADVVQGMVGAAQEELFPPRPDDGPTGSEADTTRGLSISGLSAGEELHDVSFAAQPGEIIGLAGLEGSGVATLLGVLFGTRKATSGVVRYPDGEGLPGSPTKAAQRGVSLVPADRRNQGLMLDRSVVRNITLVSVGAMGGRRQLLSPGSMLEATRRQIDRLKIKVRDPQAPVSSMSGGNQQRLVARREAMVAERVLIAVHPTRGLDVLAAQEVQTAIIEERDAGSAILFISDDLDEVLLMSDRIAVMYEGRIMGVFDRADADRETIGLMMGGHSLEEATS